MTQGLLWVARTTCLSGRACLARGSLTNHLFPMPPSVQVHPERLLLQNPPNSPPKNCTFVTALPILPTPIPTNTSVAIYTTVDWVRFVILRPCRRHSRQSFPPPNRLCLTAPVGESRVTLEPTSPSTATAGTGPSAQWVRLVILTVAGIARNPGERSELAASVRRRNLPYPPIVLALHLPYAALKVFWIVLQKENL